MQGFFIGTIKKKRSFTTNRESRLNKFLSGICSLFVYFISFTVTSMKKFVSLVVVLALVLLVWFLYRAIQPPELVDRFSGLRIASTIYPLGFVAEHIGGISVRVAVLTPPGVEAHEFEPSVQDIAGLYNADLFLYVGAHFDPWADRLRPELEANGVRVISLAESLNLSRIYHRDGEDVTDRDGGSLDPHFWLDPQHLVRATSLITQALQSIDPGKQDVYQQRADEFVASLTVLEDEYRSGLSECTLHDALVSHDAFGYLGDRFNITFHAVSGLSPESEPTPRTLAELTKLAEDKNIRVVFFETLTSPRIAETIAREIGGMALMLNPIEGLTSREASVGSTYFTLMNMNLKNLRTALQCL